MMNWTVRYRDTEAIAPENKRTYLDEMALTIVDFCKGKRTYIDTYCCVCDREMMEMSMKFLYSNIKNVLDIRDMQINKPADPFVVYFTLVCPECADKNSYKYWSKEMEIDMFTKHFERLSERKVGNSHFDPNAYTQKVAIMTVPTRVVVSMEEVMQRSMSISA
jgi:hypothetical protein